MKQQNKCATILFSNGLRGWHLPEGKYGKCYEDMLQLLLQTGKPVYVVLTTDDLKPPIFMKEQKHLLTNPITKPHRLLGGVSLLTEWGCCRTMIASGIEEVILCLCDRLICRICPGFWRFTALM